MVGAQGLTKQDEPIYRTQDPKVFFPGRAGAREGWRGRTRSESLLFWRPPSNRFFLGRRAPAMEDEQTGKRVSPGINGETKAGKVEELKGGIKGPKVPMGLNRSQRFSTGLNGSQRVPTVHNGYPTTWQ